jgi:hypothetical protein
MKFLILITGFIAAALAIDSDHPRFPEPITYDEEACKKTGDDHIVCVLPPSKTIVSYRLSQCIKTGEASMTCWQD